VFWYYSIQYKTIIDEQRFNLGRQCSVKESTLHQNVQETDEMSIFFLYLQRVVVCHGHLCAPPGRTVCQTACRCRPRCRYSTMTETRPSYTTTSLYTSNTKERCASSHYQHISSVHEFWQGASICLLTPSIYRAILGRGMVLLWWKQILMFE